jgi:hypothetical protein
MAKKGIFGGTSGSDGGALRQKIEEKMVHRLIGHHHHNSYGQKTRMESPGAS